MYGIFTYIYHKFMVNVGKYFIHVAPGQHCFEKQRPLLEQFQLPVDIFVGQQGSLHFPWLEKSTDKCSRTL